MPSIRGSVGRGGKNYPDDVKTVQALLNQHRLQGQTQKLKVDGKVGPKTIACIEAFQKQVVKMVRPDGRVDPGGKTIKHLAAGAGKAPVATQTQGASKNVSAMTLGSKGEKILKDIEKLRLQPYDDQTGKEITAWVKGATIGYGHLIAKSDWKKYQNGITKADADKLFKTDAAPFVKAVQSKVKVKLTQNQFDALVILTFNIGTSGFGSSSVLKIVNDPAAKTPYKDLESAWKAWNKSQGKVMKGLKNRRDAEWKIYSKNVYQTW